MGANLVIYGENVIYNELNTTLYGNSNPYCIDYSNYKDSGYPHTNIMPELLDVIFSITKPSFVLEIGSMLGGSCNKIVDSLKKQNIPATVSCVDPFTGDVNMWAWEQTQPGWKFLRNENGIPTIYKRFLANTQHNKDRIIPINCTSIVGIKLLKRLKDENRISELPSIIYLDSAHEEDETYIELKQSWNLLPNNGILFGDDWNWQAVQNDVTKFSKQINPNFDLLNKIKNYLPEAVISGNILLYKGQWVLIK